MAYCLDAAAAYVLSGLMAGRTPHPADPDDGASEVTRDNTELLAFAKAHGASVEG